MVLKTFSQTCDKPYDRHWYELVMTNGTKHLIGDYDDMRAIWFRSCQMGCLSHVNVVDNPQYGKKKGFA